MLDLHDPDIPILEDRANNLLREYRRRGVVGAVRSLADHTALTLAHTHNRGNVVLRSDGSAELIELAAAPLSEEQVTAVGRWIHAVADRAAKMLAHQTPLGGDTNGWTNDGHTVTIRFEAEYTRLDWTCPHTDADYTAVTSFDDLPDCAKNWTEGGKPDPEGSPLDYCNPGIFVTATGSAVEAFDPSGGAVPAVNPMPVEYRWDNTFECYVWRLAPWTAA